MSITLISRRECGTIEIKQHLRCTMIIYCRGNRHRIESARLFRLRGMARL